MSTNRLEAFSDGVFAIAAPLLVLELHMPSPGSGELGHELATQWPSYAAFVISFLTIGIIWINHHAMVRRLRRVDLSILTGNLLSLMGVVFALMNRHILFNRVELLEDEPDEPTRRRTLGRAVLGVIPYLVATLLALATPYLTLGICAAVALCYALPVAAGEQGGAASQA